MRTIIAIACLGLLTGAQPAGAQTTHELKVSRHPNVAISNSEVDTILINASRVLQRNSVSRGTRGIGACDVTFKLKGSVETFVSPNTPAIVDEHNIEAVHREHSDPNFVSVKVVEDIRFCRSFRSDPSHPIWGCSWPWHYRSTIVRRDAPFPEIVWAHEFGHLTGLWHRGERTALMTICPLAADQVKVDQIECSCYLGGPGSCITPEVDPGCGP